MRVFRSTVEKPFEYVQEGLWRKGTYTYQALVKSAVGYAFAFQYKDLTWEVFDCSWQLGSGFSQVEEVGFELKKDAIAFKLIANPITGEILVGLPMLEDGTNKSTPIAHEEDLRGMDGDFHEFIFTRNDTGIAPDAPLSEQEDDHIPIDDSVEPPVIWTDNPQGVTKELPFEFVSMREKKNGVWLNFSPPSLWAKWAEDGFSLSLQVQGHFVSHWEGTEKVTEIVGGEYIDDEEVVKVTAVIRKGEKDVTVDELQSRGFRWYVNGFYNPAWDDQSYITLDETYGDGFSDFVILSYLVNSLREEVQVEIMNLSEGMDGIGEEFIFIAHDSEVVPPELPQPTDEGYQEDDYHGHWSDDPVSPTEVDQFVWTAKRKKVGGIWEPFGAPSVWTRWVEDGKDGKDAAYWELHSSAPLIYKDAEDASMSGAHTSITLSGRYMEGASSQNGGYISVQPNGGVEDTPLVSPREFTPPNNAGVDEYVFRLYDNVSKTTLLDTLTVPIAFKGEKGVSAINITLSNEADALPASPEGVVLDYSGSGTTIRVFEGSQELSYGTGNGQYQVVASGSNISPNSTPTTNGNARVYGNASNMGAAKTAVITFTVSGKTFGGEYFSFDKVQNFTKAERGDTGASAPLLYLSASAQVMKCNSDNTPQAGQTISIEAKLQNVTGTATFVATPYNDAGTALSKITLGGSGNTRTITNAQWLATFKRVEVVATLGSLTDKVTIHRVADGGTGKGISGTEIKYQVGASGTTEPTGTWLTSVPTVPEGQYLWTRTVTSYTDGTSTKSYSVSKQGVSGSDGKGISSTVITYQASTSGTVIPTGTWSGTIPSVSENQYLWTRTVITYTDNSTSSSYSVGKMGAKGDKGENSIVGFLTNENITLQASNAGVVSSFTSANGEFWVFNGTTKVTSGVTFSKVSQTGCTATITSAGVYSVSAMSADNATVVFRAVYSGVTIDKILTLSKSKAGGDGDGITSTTIHYAKSSNGNTPPSSGWSTSLPSPTQGWYLWTRTTTTYKVAETTVSYSVSHWAEDGDGIVSTTIEYAKSSSGTTKPTSGWSTSIPSPTKGWYLWTRTTTVYKTSPTTVAYSVSYWSKDGDDAKDIRLTATNTQAVIGTNGVTPTQITVTGTAKNTYISGWSFSVDGGSFTTPPNGVTRTGDVVTINTAIATWRTLAIKAFNTMDNVDSVITISIVGYGAAGEKGKVPIVKEWLSGDTHLNNDDVVDFIYYRPTRTWWKLKDAYTSRQATSSPSTTYYEQINYMSALATKVLIAEEANLANFIFKDGKLISVRGTVNGAAVDYAGQAGFMPSIVIDGKTGNITVQTNTIGGSVWTGSLSPNGLIFEVSYINGTYSPKTIWIAGSGAITITDESDPNEYTSAHIGSSDITVQRGSIQTVIAPGSIKHNNKDIKLYSNVRTIGATSTLTDTDEVVVAAGMSGITLTMPTATVGRILKIKNRASKSITLSSSKQFFASSVTSVINMASGDAVELVYDGTYWCVM